jgi:hypothetical protein
MRGHVEIYCITVTLRNYPYINNSNEGICMEENTNKFQGSVLYLKQILPDPVMVASVSDIYNPLISSLSCNAREEPIP